MISAARSHVGLLLLFILGAATVLFCNIGGTNAANNFNVVSAWSTVHTPLGSAIGFGKSILITERPNEQLDVTHEPVLVVGAPDFNSGEGAVCSFRFDRDVVGDGLKWTYTGLYTGDVNAGLSESYGGNTTSILNGATGSRAGLGLVMASGNVTSGALNEHVVFGVYNSEEDHDTELDLMTGFEQCDTSFYPVCGTKVASNLRFRVGQILASRVRQENGFAASGAFFSATPPEDDKCFDPIRAAVSGSTASLRRNGARPRPLCTGQMGASVALGKLWNANPSASVAQDAQEIIAGAPLADRVHLFSLPETAVQRAEMTSFRSIPPLQLQGISSVSFLSSAAIHALEGFSYFGLGTSSANFNDDAWEDIVVGSPRRTDPIGRRSYVGSVSIYSVVQGESPMKVAEHPFFQVYGTRTGAYFGWKSLALDVITTLDMNTADKPDLIVSAPLEDVVRDDGTILKEVGCMYVFIGSGLSTGPFKPYHQRICGRKAGERFGYEIRAIGDVNEDGIQDFAVGAPFYNVDTTALKAGCLYLFLGSPEHLNPEADQIICGSHANEMFGYSFAGQHDLTKDFMEPYYADIAVSRPGTSDVFVFQTRAVAEVSLSGVALATSILEGQSGIVRFCVANDGPSDAIGVRLQYGYNYTCGSCSSPPSGLTTLPLIPVGSSRCFELTALAVAGCCNIAAWANIDRISQGPNDVPMTFGRNSILSLTEPVVLPVCSAAPSSTCGINIATSVFRLAPSSNFILGDTVAINVLIRLVSGDSTSDVVFYLDYDEGLRFSLAQSLLQGFDCEYVDNQMRQTAYARATLSSPSQQFPSYQSLPEIPRFTGLRPRLKCYLQNALSSSRRNVNLEFLFDSSMVPASTTSLKFNGHSVSNQLDTSPSDNAFESILSIAPPSLDFVVRGEQPWVIKNYPFTFSVAVHNSGGRVASNIVLNVNFPFDSARLVAISSTDGSCDVAAYNYPSASYYEANPSESVKPFLCSLSRLPQRESAHFYFTGVFNASVMSSDVDIDMRVSMISQHTSLLQNSMLSAAAVRVTWPKDIETQSRQLDDSDVAWGVVVAILVGLAVLALLLFLVLKTGVLQVKNRPPWQQLKQIYGDEYDLEHAAFVIPKTEQEIEAEEIKKAEERQRKKNIESLKKEEERAEKARVKEIEKQLKETERLLKQRRQPTPFFEVLKEEIEQGEDEVSSAPKAAKPQRRFSFSSPPPLPLPPKRMHPRGVQTWSGPYGLAGAKTKKLRKKEIAAVIASFADEKDRVTREREAAKLKADNEKQKVKFLYETVSGRPDQWDKLKLEEIEALKLYGFLDEEMAAQMTLRLQKKKAIKSASMILEEAMLPAPSSASSTLESTAEESTSDEKIEITPLPVPPTQSDLFLEEVVVDSSTQAAQSPTGEESSSNEDSTKEIPPLPLPLGDGSLSTSEQDGESKSVLSQQASSEYEEVSPPFPLPLPPPGFEKDESTTEGASASQPEPSDSVYEEVSPPFPLPLPPPSSEKDEATTEETSSSQPESELPPPPPIAALTQKPPFQRKPSEPAKPQKVLRPAPISPPGDNTLYDSD